ADDTAPGADGGQDLDVAGEDGDDALRLRRDCHLAPQCIGQSPWERLIVRLSGRTGKARDRKCCDEGPRAQNLISTPTKNSRPGRLFPRPPLEAMGFEM